ncbi:MAG: hypothetical protein JJE39_06365 [Vicinamibacteria bacterium]|nr:hypothetical protein [Vicinamibacteria bacterium]
MEMVRYCPVCDDEFRPDITVCSDCGTALILQREGLGAEGVPASALVSEEAEAQPNAGWHTALDALPVSNLLPIRTFDALRDLEPTVSAFADVRLPSRVLVQNGRYILLIRPDDLAVAQETLQAAHADPAELEELSDATFDSTAGRYSHCPACGSQLAHDLTGACPDCGLELSAPSGAVNVPEPE